MQNQSPQLSVVAIMVFLLVIGFVLLLLHLALLGLALAEGFVLHWAIPSIDLSIAVLIGLLATLATAHFAVLFIRIAMQSPPWATPTDDDEEDEDEDDDEEDDEEEDEEEEPPKSPRPPQIEISRTRLRRRRRR